MSNGVTTWRITNALPAIVAIGHLNKAFIVAGPAIVAICSGVVSIIKFTSSAILVLLTLSKNVGEARLVGIAGTFASNLGGVTQIPKDITSWSIANTLSFGVAVSW